MLLERIISPQLYLSILLDPIGEACSGSHPLGTVMLQDPGIPIVVPALWHSISPFPQNCLDTSEIW